MARRVSGKHLEPDLIAVLDGLLRDHPRLSARRVVAMLAERTGVSVHHGTVSDRRSRRRMTTKLWQGSIPEHGGRGWPQVLARRTAAVRAKKIARGEVPAGPIPWMPPLLRVASFTRERSA